MELHPMTDVRERPDESRSREALIEKLAEAIRQAAVMKMEEGEDLALYVANIWRTYARAALATIEAEGYEIPTSLAEAVPDLGNTITGERWRIQQRIKALLMNGPRLPLDLMRVVNEHNEWAEEDVKIALLDLLAMGDLVWGAHWIDFPADELPNVMDLAEPRLESRTHEAEQQAEVAALVAGAREGVYWLGEAFERRPMHGALDAADRLQRALEPFERTLGSTRNEARTTEGGSR